VVPRAVQQLQQKPLNHLFKGYWNDFTLRKSSNFIHTFSKEDFSMTDLHFNPSKVFRIRTLGLVASSWMMIGCGDTIEMESQWAEDTSENAMEAEVSSLAEDAEAIPIISGDDVKWEGEAQVERDREYAKAGFERKEREVRLTRADRREIKKLVNADRVAFDRRDPADDDRRVEAAKSQTASASRTFDDLLKDRFIVYQKRIEYSNVVIEIIKNKTESNEEKYDDDDVIYDDATGEGWGLIKFTWGSQQVKRDGKRAKITAVKFENKEQAPLYAIKNNKLYFLKPQKQLEATAKPIKFKVTFADKEIELEFPGK
jgi:hypothetical protein